MGLNQQQFQASLASLKSFASMAGSAGNPPQPGSSPITSPTVAASPATNNPTQLGSSMENDLPPPSEVATAAAAAPTKEPGFFSRVATDFKNRVANIRQNTTDNNAVFNDPNAGGGDKAASFAANTVNDVGQMVAVGTDTLGEAIKATGIPKAIANIKIINGVTGEPDTLGNSIATNPTLKHVVGKITDAWKSFEKMDPIDAKTLGGFGNIVGGLLAADGIQATGEGLVSNAKDFAAGAANSDVTVAKGLAGGPGAGTPGAGESFATKAGKAFGSTTGEAPAAAGTAPAGAGDLETPFMASEEPLPAPEAPTVETPGTTKAPNSTSLKSKFVPASGQTKAAATYVPRTFLNDMLKTAEDYKSGASTSTPHFVNGEQSKGITDSAFKESFDTANKAKNDALIKTKDVPVQGVGDVVQQFNERLNEPSLPIPGGQKLFRDFQKELDQISSGGDIQEGPGGKKIIVDEATGKARPATADEIAAGAPTVKQLNDFIDRWQKIAAKNVDGNGLISGVLYGKNGSGGLNGLLRSATTPVDGGVYAKANDELSNLIQQQNKYQTLSEKPHDFSQAFLDPNKPLQGVQDVSGHPLDRRAAIADAFTAATGVGDKASALSKLRLSFNPLLAGVRTAIGFALDDLRSPKALYDKLVEIQDAIAQNAVKAKK